MEAITVGSAVAKSGEITHGKLPVDGTDLELDVYLIKGAQNGPTGFITGGFHGDEVNGPRLVELFIQSIEPADLSGTIICVPIANPRGFEKSMRHVPEDDRDLNRAFGDLDADSMSSRIASTLKDSVLNLSTFGIDCHDAGDSHALLPQVRVHIDEDGLCDDGCTVEMGKVFGTQIVLQRKGEPGMMAIEMFKKTHCQY